MMTLHFEWDEAKAETNLKKHGVAFEEAKSVFFDDHVKLIPDPNHSINEERFVLMGYSSKLNSGRVPLLSCKRTNNTHHFSQKSNETGSKILQKVSSCATNTTSPRR